MEGEGYDPNEPDPEPYDDSEPLDLAVLEDDTLQLYLSDEETDEVVPPPPADETAPAAAAVIPPTPTDFPSSSDAPPPPPADLASATTNPPASIGTETRPVGTEAQLQQDPPAV